MNVLLGYIVGQLLEVIEKELISEIPAIIDLTVKEIKLLIEKLENILKTKSGKDSDKEN
jgi:hypothetical protein